MKTTITVCSAAFMLFTTATSRADIIAGPITNPANGHDYYLLSPNPWTVAEAEAESLNGTLAIIRNAGEEKWVFSTFAAYGGTNRNLWIGLHRVGPNRSLAWATGEPFVYGHWAHGQPDDAGGRENAVFMVSGSWVWGYEPGSWDDMGNEGMADGSFPYGVVELPGKAKSSLSKADRALIGDWYVAGNIERPCWITGTDKALFIVSNSRYAARAVLGDDGILRVPNFPGGWLTTPMVENDFGLMNSMPGATQTEIHGEVFKDNILWSNGTWWSRKPSESAIKQAKQ